jgi:hypothetical protein
VPLFADPVEVRAGDTADIRLHRVVADDRVHVDYRIDATVRTASGTTSASVESRHHGVGLGAGPVYRELFETWVN